MVFDSKQMASKFLDGDLNSKQEIDQLIAQSDAKDAYSRYQLIGNIMRQEAVAPDVSIADTVMASLANEATILAPQADTSIEIDTNSDSDVNTNTNVVSLPNRFGKQIGGFAIAASVALVALFSANLVTTPQDAVSQGLVANIDSSNQPANSVDRLELQKAHQLFTELSQLQNAGLPVIQTVSNQKAVAITVPLVAPSVVADVETIDLEKTDLEKNTQNKDKQDDKK